MSLNLRLFFTQLTFLRFPRRCYFLFGLPLHWNFSWGFDNFTRVANHWDSPVNIGLLFAANNYKLAPFCLFDRPWGWNRTRRCRLVRTVEEFWIILFEWRAKLGKRVLSLQLRHPIVTVPVRKKFEFLPDCKFVGIRRLPSRHLNVLIQTMLENCIVSEFLHLVSIEAIFCLLVDVGKGFVFCPMLRLAARVNLIVSVKPEGLIIELFF